MLKKYCGYCGCKTSNRIKHLEIPGNKIIKNLTEEESEDLGLKTKEICIKLIRDFEEIERYHDTRFHIDFMDTNTRILIDFQREYKKLHSLISPNRSKYLELEKNIDIIIAFDKYINKNFMVIEKALDEIKEISHDILMRISAALVDLLDLLDINSVDYSPLNSF